MTFRNCSLPGRTVKAFECLTHSDEFVPEFMQATKNIRYEGINTATAIGLTVTNRNTWSGRLQNWWDTDGSATMRPGRPTIMGSLFGGDWWKLDDACERAPSWYMWLCDKTPSRSVGSFLMNYDTIQAQVGSSGTICGNGNLAPCPTVGQAIHIGRSDWSGALNITSNPKITGPTGGFGWYVKLFKGAPRFNRLYQIQVNTTEKLVVAMPYPAGTRFNVTARIQSSTCASWCRVDWGCLCKWDFRPVNSVEEVRNGAGDTYYFDGRHLYFRCVAVHIRMGYCFIYGFAVLPL